MLAMDERRRAPRQRVLKTGTIFFNNGRSSTSCVLRNVSSGGALLKIENTLGVPAEFRLRFDGHLVDCVSVRRTVGEIGVAFVAPLQISRGVHPAPEGRGFPPLDDLASRNEQEIE